MNFIVHVEEETDPLEDLNATDEIDPTDELDMPSNYILHMKDIFYIVSPKIATAKGLLQSDRNRQDEAVIINSIILEIRIF